MRPDVHHAALRAAARVAFSIAISSPVSLGCASIEPTEPTETDEGALSANAPATPSKAEPPLACDAVLASAFPNPDPTHYQYEPVPATAEIAACCKDELTAHDAASAYRWECCVAYDPALGPGSAPTMTSELGIACTPWGPPVPPSMKRARGLRAERRVS